MKHLFTLGLVSLSLSASLNQTLQTNSSSTQHTKASQTKIDNLSDQEREAFAKYRETLREIQTLKTYNQQLRELIQSQNEEMASIKKQIVEIEVTQQRILPLMKEMTQSFQTFVHADTPFLKEERTKRADRLETLLSKANLTISQKFRSIIEAFSIELEFGRTIEAFDAPLNERQSVLFLRIGRTALFYMTKDEEEVGIYNPNSKKFETIDSDYLREIKKGIKIAKKQLAPELLTLPVIALKESK